MKKKYLLKFAVFFIVTLLSLNYVSAAITFDNPTPDNGNITYSASIPINISVNETTLKNFWLNWNGTNYTFYNDSLVLMFNFDNVATLDENATKAVDVSRYGNNGTFLNGTTWTAAGKYGSAVQFNGINNYIDCGNAPSLNITSDMTMEAWAKLNRVGLDQKIAGKEDGVSGGYKFGVYSDNKFELEIRDASNNPYLSRSVLGGTALQADQWYHLVGVYSRSGDYIKTYINGVLDRTLSPVGGVLAPTTSSLKIGKEPFGDLFFWNGTMDEFHVYNYSLSADEVTQHYRSYLYKYDAGKWQFYTNESNLTSRGSYTYGGCANDTAGNQACTETRTIYLGDWTPPTISFADPTPANGTITSNTSAAVNISITNASDLGEFKWNWNGTNYTFYNDSLVLMLNLDNVTALGENATKAVDVSRNRNNGTFSNNPTWTTAGKYDQALNFAGTTYVTTGIKGFSASEGTVLMWIKPNNNLRTVSQAFFDTKPSAIGALRIYSSNDNTLHYEIGGAASLLTWTIPSDWTGQWHQIGLNWSGSVTALIVDGAVVASGSNSQAPAISTFEIGRYNTGSNFNGAIDEVHVYNKTLSAAEIQQRYYSNLYKYDTDKWAFYTNQSNLTAGTYSYLGFVKDTNNNANQTALNYLYIDLTAPTTTLASPSPNGNITTSNMVTFTCNATDNFMLKNITFYWNYTGTFQANETVAVSGKFNQTTFARTKLNNTAILWNCIACDNLSQCSFASANWTVTVNYTNLVLSIVSPTNTTYNNRTQLVNISSNGNNMWFFNGTTNVTYTTPVLVTFSEGANIILAYVNDTAGNENSTSVTFSVDTNAPNITIFQPADGFVNISRNLTFNFTAVDTLSASLSCDLIINGAVNATNSSVANNTATYFAVKNFNHGDYTYNVSCFDNANNLNFSSTRNFTMNISPIISYINASPPTIKGGNVITLNATGIDDPNNDTVNLYCSNTTAAPKASSTICTGGTTTKTSPPYTLNCTFVAPTGSATHTAYCRAFDGKDYSATVNASFTTDGTPPTTTIGSVAGDLNATYYDNVDDSITIINISGEAGMQCRIGTSDIAYSSMSNECAITGTHANCTWTTTEQGNDAYNLYVSCRDSLLNEQNSSQNNDITSFVTDWTAPNTTDNSDTNIYVAPYNVTITEGDNVDSDVTTFYCTDTSGACAPDTAIDNGGTITFTSSNRGTNYLRYNSTDDAGNQQETTNVTININLFANFTNATDGVATVRGGGNVTILTNSTDKDSQTLKLFVCKTASANSSGCSSAANTYCSNTTATQNASCSFIAEADNSAHAWYSFIYDSLNESAFENHTGSYISDSIAPNLTIISPTNSTHTQNSLLASILTSENAILAGYSLDGAANITFDRISDTIWSITLTSLANGGHEIVYYANDSVNNTGTAIRIFSVDAAGVDTTAPSIVIVAPTNNSGFNKAGTSILLNITVDENVSWAGYSLDGAANVSMGNISLRSWNATLTNLADGDHNIKFFANDTSLNMRVSDMISFSADANSPLQMEFNITPLAVNDSVNVTIYSKWNDAVGLSFGFIEENSTGTKVNHTISLSGTDAWANFTINASGMNPGDLAIVVYVNDTANNFNSTSVLIVSVADVTPPIFNVTYSPTNPDDIDPGVIINMTANVSDYSNASVAILQFMETNASVWNNFTMTHTGNGTFIGNFTPSTTSNWTFRVWANDSVSNANTSANTTLEVSLDTSWEIIPFTDSSVSALLNSNKSIGSFMINNTGDYDLEFDLSYTPVTINIYYNQTEPFNVSSGQLVEISVNVTALVSETSTSLAIKASATNSTAQPSYNYANITFISTADGPFMLVTIQNPSEGASLTIGDSGVSLSATVKNLGTQDATGTWLKWTLPSGWTNNSALNRSIGFLGVGESATNILTAGISTSASTGTAVLTANASNLQNRNGSAARTVTVSSLATAAAQETTGGSVSSGGGGGGGTGGGGGVSLKKTIEGVEILNTSKTYELVRGGKMTFPVEVTNVFEEVTMYDVTLHMDGFLKQYLSVYPSVINKIEPGQTQTFDVTITSPKYQEEGQHDLQFTITGRLVGIKVEELEGGNKITSYLKKDLIEKRLVRLIIHDISKEEATVNLDEAKKAVDEVNEAGLPSEKITGILEEAITALEKKQYKTVKELSEKIIETRNKAFEADALIKDVKRRIAAAEESGISAEQSKKLLNFALAAFEREDFDTTIKRAKDALLSVIIETKGKVNYVVLFKKYWPGLLSSLVILSLLAYLLRQRLILILISRRLEDLEKETVSIQQLIEEAQTKTFTEKTMSTTEYHKVMYQYENRLAEIRDLQMKLRTRKTKIIRITDEINILRRESEQVKESLKQLQTEYYTRGKLSKNKYLRCAETYKLRMIEVEKAITMLEAKLAKKEKLEILNKLKEKVAKHEKELRLTPRQIDEIDKKVEESKKHYGLSAEELIGKAAEASQPEMTAHQQRQIPSPKISPERMVIISRLKEQFAIDKIKEKRRLGDDIKRLEEHGFKVKPPKPEQGILDSRLHSRERILKKLKEVHHHV